MGFRLLILGFGVVRELADATTLCLTFKSSEAEARYARRSDPCPLAVAAPPLMLLPAVVALASFAVPPSRSLHAVYLAFILETGLINIIYYACFRYAQFKVLIYSYERLKKYMKKTSVRARRVSEIVATCCCWLE